MSRYQDYDGDSNENTVELWQHNLELALSGKRGKQALADLKAALEALPEKRLIERALCTVNIKLPDLPESEMDTDDVVNSELLRAQGRGVCAVGAYAWWQKVKSGKDPQTAFEELDVLPDTDGDIWDTVEAGKSAGLTTVLAWELAYTNDETFGGLTPEERYAKFMAWIDKQLALPPAPPRPPKRVRRVTKVQEKLASWQQLATGV